MGDGSEIIGVAGPTGGMIALAVVFSVAWWVVVSIGLAKVFQKLGEEGWKAWVPVLNAVVFFQLGGYSALWVIGMFVPVVNIVALVFFYLASHEINTRLGKGVGFTVLSVFLFGIWALVLGFGPAGSVSGAATRDEISGHGAPESWRPITPQRFESPPSDSAAGPNESMSDQPMSNRSLPNEPVTPHRAPTRPPIDQVPGIRTAAPTAPVMPAVPVTESPVARAEVIEARVTDARITEAPGVATPVVETPMIEAPVSVVPPWVVPVVPYSGAGVPPAPVMDTPQTIDTPQPLDDPLDDATIITGTQKPVADHDETVIVNRQMRQPWTLQTAQGQTIQLTSDVVLLGRNPVADPTYPTAQLVAVRDSGKTVSKLHARIMLNDGRWTVTDLDSTNGVIVVDAGGIETELSPGSSFVLGENFLLGELPTRIFSA